ncbi:MAG: class I SAM-dependent methyltransferase [Bacteroidales bacterium]|nr:class I SAM-dependent methyltransferase [Bacteroidales bacterium]
MEVDEFLKLFMQELQMNSHLRSYYRLLNNKNLYFWRKAYFEKRLRYVNDMLPPKKANIWDVGCGYGTTAIFLALNGHKVLANTLEFYYDKINERLNYWKQFGDLSNLEIEYANLFDMPVKQGGYDVIIAQDTLHHLEPIDEAMLIFRKSLAGDGRMIVTEENGHNVFIMLKNFLKRGFKRVTSYYDEKLQKTIRFGNENARSFSKWHCILSNAGMIIPGNSIGYVRFFPPFVFNKTNYYQLQKKEAEIGKKCRLLREILFFGINFTAEISPNNKL